MMGSCAGSPAKCPDIPAANSGYNAPIKRLLQAPFVAFKVGRSATSFIIALELLLTIR